MATKAKAQESTESVWSNLTVEDAEPITRSNNRVNQLEGTPFVGWLENSYAERSTKAVTVHNGDAKKVMNLLRLAATQLNIGLRVKAVENGSQTRIVFSAGDKRKHTDNGSAVCPVCNSEQSLTGSGLVRVHGPRASRCAGSGASV